LHQRDEIIDFSPQNVLRELYPGALPPDLYEEEFIEIWSNDITGFIKNLKHYKKLSGRMQVLDRYDALAISVATAYPKLFSVEDFLNMPHDKIERVRSFLKMVLARDINDELYSHIATIYRRGDSEQIVNRWAAISPKSLRRLIFLVLMAQRYLIPNPLMVIRGYSLLDFDTKGLEKEIYDIINGLNKNTEFLLKLSEKIEDNFAEQEISQLVEEFKFGSHQDVLHSLSNETSPLISLNIIKTFLNEYLKELPKRNVFSKLDSSLIETRDIQISGY
jgi:hypothetical protein